MNQTSARLIFALIMMLTMLVAMTGCSGFGTSRWAMDDPVYAEKYDEPYPSNDLDKAERLMKQSVDARYVEGRSGFYAGAAASDDPVTGGVEVGGFHYLNHSIEGRVGLKGLLGTGASDYFGGVDTGLRIQSPSRLAPFAGVGGYVGGNGRSEPAEDDLRDNDDDGSIDELGEEKNVGKFFASVYPEVGAHFWLNGQTRLTASAQYHLTTAGRDDDFLFIGLSIGFLSGNRSSDEWKPLDSDDE